MTRFWWWRCLWRSAEGGVGGLVAAPTALSFCGPNSTPRPFGRIGRGISRRVWAFQSDTATPQSGFTLRLAAARISSSRSVTPPPAGRVRRLSTASASVAGAHHRDVRLHAKPSLWLRPCLRVAKVSASSQLFFRLYFGTSCIHHRVLRFIIIISLVPCTVSSAARPA